MWIAEEADDGEVKRNLLDAEAVWGELHVADTGG